MRTRFINERNFGFAAATKLVAEHGDMLEATGAAADNDDPGHRAHLIGFAPWAVAHCNVHGVVPWCRAVQSWISTPMQPACCRKSRRFCD
jgi:hypothetical protein